MKTGQLSVVVPCWWAVITAHADHQEQRQFQVVDDVAQGVAGSKKPVHWIITTGRLPPSNSPAAITIASPSRQARTRYRPGSALERRLPLAQFGVGNQESRRRE